MALTGTGEPSSKPGVTPKPEPRYIQRRRARRRKRLLLGASAVAAAGLIAMVVVVSSGDNAPAYSGSTLDIELSEYAITGELTAPTGLVRLRATNIGGERHNVGKRGGPITGDLQTGAEISLDLGLLQPGTYELYCDLPQHQERGMVAKLIVT